MLHWNPTDATLSFDMRLSPSMLEARDLLRRARQLLPSIGDVEICGRRRSPLCCSPEFFNPMHEGNVLLARVAEELRQQPLAFEISVTNVDKPPLAGETVRQRLAQFA